MEVRKLETKIKDTRKRSKVKKDIQKFNLGTSKLNYCDPRITVSWCKRNNLQPTKIYNKTQIERFNWALDAPEDF